MSAGDGSVPDSVVQVLAVDGEVAGAGFLVAADAVVTCAHVVRAAGQGPGGRVRLAFPHLPGAPRVWGEVPAEQRRMLMLLGSSGAGKTSLVNAGVLPALADGALSGSDRWLPVVTRPGQDFFAELENAGLPGASTDCLTASAGARLDAEPGFDRLLIVDQFEELLTRPGPVSDSDASERPHPWRVETCPRSRPGRSPCSCISGGGTRARHATE
ncbi:hypothetical protein GCM10010387_21770 [Streptomyces inusitatus]|uniref:Novel STAND NTPase 1 domain-containing protein n=1 Tax=Streptomyces inusitatus TaxID=68221 RepID=A0A918PYX2_9ACTN|nr:hypothetical protein [Streptomyces inusitatus]GGZ28013.1 hypothetical protein GCM10010387_21770 [Streptomyces inusitatus]